MAENFREFQPGNSSENGRGTQRENNKNNSFGRLATSIAILFIACGAGFGVGLFDWRAGAGRRDNTLAMRAAW